MMRNESMAISVGAGGYSAVAIAPDADFELRWAASEAHERAVRRQLILVGGVAGPLAAAVAMAYTLLRP
jgi:hypothetical protein